MRTNKWNNLIDCDKKSDCVNYPEQSKDHEAGEPISGTMAPRSGRFNDLINELVTH